MPKAQEKARAMRALTPMQLDTLTSFYYGEVRLMWVPTRSYSDGYANALKFFNADGIDISGRVKSLQRRKLIKYQFPNKLGDGMVVWITEAGVKEMEAIDA